MQRATLRHRMGPKNVKSTIVLCFKPGTNQTVTVLGCSKTCDNLILKTNNAALGAEDLLLSRRTAEAVTRRVTAAAARCPLTCRSIRASPKDPAAVGMRLTRVRLTTARELCTIFKTPVNTCQLQCPGAKIFGSERFLSPGALRCPVYVSRKLLYVCVSMNAYVHVTMFLLCACLYVAISCACRCMYRMYVL